VPGASATLECEGEEHRVSWERGKFKLHDHDLGAERAMLVLGGEPSTCLRALRMWRDQFGMPPEIFDQMPTWLGDQAVLAPPELELPRQLGMMLSWARSWRHWRYLDKHGRLLQERGRLLALPLFRQHLLEARQAFGSRVISVAKVDIVPDTNVVGVTGQMDKVKVVAAATLHPRWLVEVGPRGFAVVDGCFVVEVIEDAWDGPLVKAVRWDDREARTRKPVAAPARLRPADGEWHLTWEDAKVPPPARPGV